MIYYFILIFGLAALDQFFKILARVYLINRGFVEVIPNFITLVYQENRGVSFSFLADSPDWIRLPLLIGVSGVVVTGMVLYLIRYRASLTSWEKWGYSLIIAGALGNLVDRIFRDSVTDYMFFHFFETGFFVNNLADDLISIGFVILLKTFFLTRNQKQEPRN